MQILNFAGNWLQLIFTLGFWDGINNTYKNYTYECSKKATGDTSGSDANENGQSEPKQ